MPKKYTKSESDLLSAGNQKKECKPKFTFFKNLLRRKKSKSVGDLPETKVPIVIPSYFNPQSNSSFLQDLVPPEEYSDSSDDSTLTASFSSDSSGDTTLTAFSHDFGSEFGDDISVQNAEEPSIKSTDAVHELKFADTIESTEIDAEEEPEPDYDFDKVFLSLSGEIEPIDVELMAGRCSTMKVPHQFRYGGISDYYTNSQEIDSFTKRRPNKRRSVEKILMKLNPFFKFVSI